MTHRERILCACRGEQADRIPWIPRLDLWYNARVHAGDLPHPFQGASLREITDQLDLGYHAVIPNFLSAEADDLVDRCLGISNVKEAPFTTRLQHVEREVVRRGDVARVTYHTPLGAVTGQFSYTPEMRAAGASIAWIDEHLYKQPSDYPILAYIFAHAQVIPDNRRYRAWQHWVGEAGVAVAFGSLSASPMHHIMRELMPASDFYLELMDHPEEVEALARAMEPWFAAIHTALVASSAEVILMGANYDETITYPPLFERYFLPDLSRLAELAHARGKWVLTHTDGENSGLLSLYRQCRFDIADSFCPAPMTKLTLAEMMAALPEVTVWGGIPSIAFCEDSMPDAAFERLTDEAIAFAAHHPRLILGIADTMPPNGSFARVLRMTEKVNAAR